MGLGVVESLDIEGIVPGDLWAEGHARGEPVLPASRQVQVFSRKTCPLTVEVVEQLGTPGDIIHRRNLVIEIGDCRPFLGRAVCLPKVALCQQWGLRMPKNSVPK